jgi:hypothetical protein
MFSSHSYASKQQLLRWVSSLLKIDIQALEDVRPCRAPATSLLIHLLADFEQYPIAAMTSVLLTALKSAPALCVGHSRPARILGTHISRVSAAFWMLSWLA